MCHFRDYLLGLLLFYNEIWVWHLGYHFTFAVARLSQI